jgi:hypothetical protein
MLAELPEIWLSIDERVGMLIPASTFLLKLLLNIILLLPPLLLAYVYVSHCRVMESG